MSTMSSPVRQDLDKLSRKIGIRAPMLCCITNPAVLDLFQLPEAAPRKCRWGRRLRRVCKAGAANEDLIRRAWKDFGVSMTGFKKHLDNLKRIANEN